jgi:hypothetical protein
MTQIVKPTTEEIRSAYMEDTQNFTMVDEVADTSWRHGCYMTTVYRRISDNTFWQVNWQVSGDGETNSIRDREISSQNITQVEPYDVTVVKYRRIVS